MCSPFVTAKSNRSGVLLRSVGQYVGLPVDSTLRLLFLMHFSSVLPLGVLILESHNMCFALKSPAAIYLLPKDWKYTSHFLSVILCLGGVYTADIWKLLPLVCIVTVVACRCF